MYHYPILVLIYELQSRIENDYIQYWAIRVLSNTMHMQQDNKCSSTV